MRDGLTEKEWKILQTPAHQAFGNAALQREIARIYDKRISAIRAENNKFIPAAHNGVVGVISDNLGLNGLLNHATGRHYDSKSEFRKATRRAGCVEVGSEKPKEWQPPIERGIQGDYNVRPALKAALEKHGVK